MVNASFLVGDTNIHNLIEPIMYDTNPVHYISMVSEELKWVLNEKYLFNVEVVKVKNLLLLCMNYTNK